MSTTEDELTFIQQQTIDELARKAYASGSNSNKYRFELYAYISSLFSPRLARQRIDIAQAIGYCRGLGHPDGYLERRYSDIASLKENI